MTRLLLFDIDNTLLYTGGAGSHAMAIAFQEMFGINNGFANVEFSGRTDLHILSEGLRLHGIAGGHETYLDDFLRRYYGHLRQTLGDRDGHLMPGFPHLLEALSQRGGVRIGLATGNFSEAAWMKVEHYKIRQYFWDGAFGEDGLHRSQMVRAGIERLAPDVAPEEVIIIGDTPHDISSALDNGVAAAGVATGSYTAHQLRESGAQMVFRDFSDWQTAATTLSGEA
ncbi:MAG TPA: HAD hydrolase-like protein [Dehalococcoidia bacterium]|nr:HAD hydrolase-like protein [Dehalococcoidia bacterium]